MNPRPTRRRALLVGVEAYPHIERPASGAVADVKVMKRLLDNLGFEVRTLVDAAATRDRILTELENLTRPADDGPDGDWPDGEAARSDPDLGAGDVALFSFAGHGSRVISIDNPAYGAATIAPVDTGRPPMPVRDIADFELMFRVRGLAESGCTVVVVLDCCHSGGFEPDEYPPRVLPPVEVTADSALIGPPGAISWRLDDGPKPGDGRLDLGRRVVLTACAENQRAGSAVVELDGQRARHGMFTFVLVRALRRGIGGLTYDELRQRVADAFVQMSAAQTPQARGDLDGYVFAPGDAAPRPVIALHRDLNGDVVDLPAGTAHGVTQGSVWKIYPRKLNGDPAERYVARVEVTTVGPLTSVARLVGARSPQVDLRTCVAVESARPPTERRLRVAVTPDGAAPAVVDGVDPVVSASPLLAVVGSAEETDVTVRVHANGSAAAYLAERPERPVGLARSVDGDAGRRVLVRLLEALARRQAGLAARPAGSPIPRLRLGLLQVLADGSMRPAEEVGGLPAVPPGGLAGRLTNLSDQQMYATVLHYAADGRVHRVWPAHGEGVAIGPQASATCGDAPGEALYAGPDADPSGRVETLKAWASSRPTDLGVWQVEPGRKTHRPPGTGGHKLWQPPLLRTAELAAGVNGRPAASDDWWDAVQVEFRVFAAAGQMAARRCANYRAQSVS